MEENANYKDNYVNMEKQAMFANLVKQLIICQTSQVSFPSTFLLRSYLLHDIRILVRDKQYEQSKKCQAESRDSGRFEIDWDVDFESGAD